MQEVVRITSDLIARPSNVSETANEELVIEYIKDFFVKLGVTVIEQKIADGRSNLIVKFGSSPLKLFFGCHMDTVEPWEDGEFKPFEPVVKNDRLYGRGAADMKGGIAAVLAALLQVDLEKIDGLAILFDIDEEYNFLGMKHFIQNCDLEFTPGALAIFPEARMTVCNAHRGLLEFEMTIKGQSAHAGKAFPGNKDQGINAILGATRSIEEFILALQEFSDPDLGPTSCNLAWLEGGTSKGEIIESRANMVPNIARFKLDIRPAQADLTADKAVSLLKEIIQKNGLTVVKEKINLDYPDTLYTDPEEIDQFIRIVKDTIGSVEYSQLDGYGEGGLMNRAFKVNAVYFGPGPGLTAHEKDEYCEIAELKTTVEVYEKCIRAYCLL